MNKNRFFRMSILLFILSCFLLSLMSCATPKSKAIKKYKWAMSLKPNANLTEEQIKREQQKAEGELSTIEEEDEPNFNKPLPRIIELCSYNCPTCKDMTPTLKEAIQKYGGKIDIYFIDTKKHPEESKKYNITIEPTQIFLNEDEEIIYRHEGIISKEELQKIIRKKFKIKD